MKKSEKPDKNNIFREDKFPNMLKADLHMHSGEDKMDHLDYSAKELIDFMHSKKFNVIAFTFHDQVFSDKKIFNYAKSKGILMIPGSEKRIEEKEVLIYAKNLKIMEEVKKLETFEDLKNFRKKHGKNILIIAPHPFFIKNQCLEKKLVEHMEIFDAVEYSHFYTWLINRNKPAVKFARKNNVTIVGNSDIHRFFQVGLSYSRINAAKNIPSVFEAIRKGNVEVITKPLSLFNFLKVLVFSTVYPIFGK